MFFSTAAVYGEMDKERLISPISPYGISKFCAEEYLKFYHRNYGIPVMICRFFSIFGKYNTKQVIYDITKKVTSDKKLMTIINPDHKRDFIHIDEAINALLFLCENSPFEGESFDIGSGQSISIMQLYKKIANILKINKKSISRIDKNIGDPKVQKSDINPLKELGYVFNKDFESHLENTIEWIINND